MSEQKIPILVTGGAGYIGSHTCKALAQAGFLPVVYDNLSTGHAYAVKWGPFIQGDLNDRTKLNEAFTNYQPRAVIHFAADAIVVESMKNPGKYYRNNTGSSIALLEAMRDQTRIWGYDLKKGGKDDELTNIRVDSVQDSSATAQDASPLQADGADLCVEP